MHGHRLMNISPGNWRILLNDVFVSFVYVCANLENMNVFVPTHENSWTCFQLVCKKKTGVSVPGWRSASSMYWNYTCKSWNLNRFSSDV